MTALRVRLSLMMFLQFFLWGAWFVTLYLVLAASGFSESVIGAAYGSAPLGAMVAPLFLGLIADRFFASEKVMGLLLLLGGGLMLLVPGAVEAGAGGRVMVLLTGHMLCFMPTLGLANTVAFSHLTQEEFPRVRVWGTLGWIVAGLVGGFLGWSGSVNLFWLAGGAAILLGGYCFTLPSTPPPSAGAALNLRALLMLDAFKLLARPAFLVFIICSTLICIPLAYYYANTSGFLANMGFKQPVSALAIGQMSELFFMLLIPFIFRRLGVKWMILIGMGGWTLRYLLFSLGAPEQVAWMLFAGVALHGICYDFFFVTGFMYTDRSAPKEIRGQAQSMLVFFTQGIGMFIGFKLASSNLAPVKPAADALAAAIAAGRGEESLSFGQQLGEMFAVGVPAGIERGVLATASGLWQAHWLLPAGMAAAVGVVFLVGFRAKKGE